VIIIIDMATLENEDRLWFFKFLENYSAVIPKDRLAIIDGRKKIDRKKGALYQRPLN
jgi:hypothetical protein